MSSKLVRSLVFVSSVRHFTTKLLRSTSCYCTDAGETMSSAVHRGLHFENRSMALLEQHLSMSLKRVGGKGDGGVDMLGWWWVPELLQDASVMGERRRIRVLAQCKAEKKKIGPKYVRELEGVLHRFHMSNIRRENLDDAPSRATPHQHLPSLGLFISESPFTKATILYAQSSSIPLLLLHLPPVDQEKTSASCENSLGTAIWNPALAGDQGLLGGQMEIRWERSNRGPDRPGLWWRNSKLPSWALEMTIGHLEPDGRTS